MNLPQKFIDTIMNELLSGTDENFEITDEDRFRILKLFLSPQTQYLKIGHFSDEYTMEVLDIIDKRCCNLHHLNLIDFWFINQKNKNISKKLVFLLTKFTNLRSLFINDFVNDQVMMTIVHSLPFLEELDIHKNSLKSFLTINSFGDWGRLNNLREMDLGGGNFWDAFTPQVVARIIESLPNLQKIKDYIFTGTAIKILAERSKRKLMFTDLSDSLTTMDTLNAVIELCPLVRTIDLFRPETGVVRQLSSLKKLQNLILIEFPTSELEQLVAESGNLYTKLVLKKGKGILNLTNLLKFCPNLYHFDYLCTNNFRVDNNTNIYCPNLYVFKIWLGLPAPEHFENIFLSFPAVEILIVTGWRTVTDTEIENLIQKNIWNQLKLIKLKYSNNLTLKTFWLLFEKCASLKRIEGAGTWEISRTDLYNIETRFENVAFEEIT